MGKGLLWCPKTCRPVDDGAAANGAPLKKVDRLVFCFATGGVPIKRAVGIPLAPGKVPRCPIAAFFNQDDLQSGAGKNFCCHAATGPAADDGDIGGIAFVLFQPCGVDMGAFRHHRVFRTSSGMSGGPS